MEWAQRVEFRRLRIMGLELVRIRMGHRAVIQGKSRQSITMVFCKSEKTAYIRKYLNIFYSILAEHWLEKF